MNQHCAAKTSFLLVSDWSSQVYYTSRPGQLVPSSQKQPEESAQCPCEWLSAPVANFHEQSAVRVGERRAVMYLLLWLSTISTCKSSVLVRTAFQYLKLLGQENMEWDPNFSSGTFFQVIGYGKHEGDSEVTAVSGQNSSSGEIPHLVLLPPSSLMSDITSIKDIKAYTSTLNVLPYHKILK